MIRVNKIKDGIYQIRVIDVNAKQFHGCLYPVEEGTSYACYLAIDEHVTLIDAIDDIYFNSVYEEIVDLLQGRSIDNIIINHVEPDHSGSFDLFMSQYPDAKVYASKAGIKAMNQQFFKNYAFQQVGLGDEISTGKYTFAFMETPQVHWPDNMWTYLKEEKILFTNDSFGQLLIDDVYDDNEISLERLLDFSREYYANIIWPNNPSVANVIKKFKSTNWEVELIAPSHGIMIQKYINEVINQYYEFTLALTKNKAVVVYDTIWNNTEIMAYTIADELKRLNYEVEIYKISTSRISLIIKEIIDAEIVALGTSNHNNCILPTVADFAERLKACRFKNRKAIAFGSYGWAPVPFKDLSERLVNANYQVLCDPIIVNYTPTENDIEIIKTKVRECLKN